MLFSLAKNMPFGNFHQVQDLAKSGSIQLRVDRGLALQWAANGGMYCPPEVKRANANYGLSMFLPAIGLSTYVVITGTWWLFLGLLALPLFGLFLLHPAVKAVMPNLSKYAGLMVVCSLFYSFTSGDRWITALSMAVLIQGFITNASYDHAVSSLIQAALRHENLFVKLWNDNRLGMDASNGHSFFVSHVRKPDGSFHHHDYKDRSVEAIFEYAQKNGLMK